MSKISLSVQESASDGDVFYADIFQGILQNLPEQLFKTLINDGLRFKITFVRFWIIL